MHRNTQPDSPFKNVFFRSSRGNEAHISLETIIRSEPPHVGCYFFNELLRRSSGRLAEELLHRLRVLRVT
jgi:hypothetical protein